MAKRNVYKIVEADTLVPTATEDICAWWYSRLNSTLWRFDEESEAWVQAIQGGGGSSYILPVATNKLLGGIKVGKGLNITSDGVLSVDENSSTYTLPVATPNILGGIKVGSTLTMSNGVLNVKNNLAAATSTVLGGIKIGFTEDLDNNLYAVKLDKNNKAYVYVPDSGGGLTEIPLADYSTVGGFISANGTEDTDLYHFVIRDDTQTIDDSRKAYVKLNYATSNDPGVIKIGYTPQSGYENKRLPLLLGKTETINGAVNAENLNKCYVELPDDIVDLNSGVSQVTWEGNFDDSDKTLLIGILLVEGNEDGSTNFEMYVPKYSVNDTSTGLSLSEYNFTLATANETTLGTVKTSEMWSLTTDNISDTMWSKWAETSYYKTLKSYIKEGLIYFKLWLQHNLITNNKDSLLFVEDTGKINLNITYTPYTTINNPNPKKLTVTDKDVSDHLASLYKQKADIDSTTGWIKADLLPDGFYDAYILCEAVLDESGKGKIYEDSEDPSSEITPRESALYFDTLTNTSYRYVGEVDGSHLFMEVSKELIYTGGDNVEITSQRQIKVKKTTGVADAYVTNEEKVIPIRRIVQKYNSYLPSEIYEIDNVPIPNRVYYGIPEGDEYVLKNRLYTYDGENNKYIELKDNDDNILFDDDIIIYLPDLSTKYGFDVLLTEGAKANSSYTVLAYLCILTYLLFNIPTDEDVIKNIAIVSCKDFYEIKGLLTALANNEISSLEIPVIDYHYYSYNGSFGQYSSNYKLTAYKWLRNGANGATEDRIYDSQNYYRLTYRIVYDKDTEVLKKTFVYQRPLMEFYPTEDSSAYIQSAYTSLLVDDAKISASGKDSIKLITGENVNLDLDTENETLTISANVEIPVTSVNTKVGDVVLTAEDVDAYTKTEVDDQLANKQNTLVAGDNIEIDSETNTISATDTVYDDTEVRELILANTTAIETEKTRAEGVEATKQDILTAGDNITINGTTISATDTIYDDTTIKADIETLKTDKQNKLVAGANITIDEDTNTISATGGGGGTSYTAGQNIDLTDDVITAKGYSYLEKTGAMVTTGELFCNVTVFEEQRLLPISELVESVSETPDYVPVYAETIGLRNSDKKIGEDNFNLKSFSRWYDYNEGYTVYTEAVDMSAVTTYPTLYSDYWLTLALKESIVSYDLATNAITTQDRTYTYLSYGSSELSKDLLATEKGVINYVSDHTIQEAPSDDKIYGRQNEAWVEVTGGSGTTNAFSKVTVGSTTATATEEDTLTIAAGANIDLSLDADSKTVTIKGIGVNSVSYSAGACATLSDSKINVALYDTQKTDTTGSDIIYIDNAKNSCTQIYTSTASEAATATANCYYALYKNDNTLINANIENNTYKLCATGTMYFRNLGSEQLTVSLPTTIYANTNSTLTTNLTPNNFYGSTTMVVPAGKVGIIHILINAIDDNFTDAIASIWGDVSIS